MEGSASILQDLTRRIGSIRIDALPDVIKAIERASRATSAGSRVEETLQTLAEMVLELPIDGSRLDAVQRVIISHAFVTCGGNISAVARLLGAERKQIERKIQRYRVKEPQDTTAEAVPAAKGKVAKRGRPRRTS